MKKFVILSTVIAVYAAVSVSAQSLAPAKNAPVADGVINANEYSIEGMSSDMKVAASLSADGKTAFFAVEAPATGWVSVGLGSFRMNGTYMVLGYDAKGSTVVSEETGRGHSHKTNAVNILTTSAVHESNGATVLEFSLPAAGFTKGSTLKMLVAYGRGDNLNSMHSNFSTLELPLSK